MANIINLPFINPYKFVVETLTIDDKYNTAPFDDAFVDNQILEWQQQSVYYQKVQNNDGIYFQFNSNYGPVSCVLVNCNNTVVATGIITPVVSTYFKVPFVGYNCFIDISNTSTITEGIYYIKLSVGSPSTIILSEPLYIKEKHKNTMLFEYSNDSNAFDVIFQNKEIFSLRCEAAMLGFQPGSSEVVYEDEPANLTTLSAYPFRTWKLKIGEAKGVTDWLIDKINRLLSCNTVKIDGKHYTKNEGSKLEPNGKDEIITKGWIIELRESKARTSSTIINDTPQNDSIVIAYPADSSLFGGVGSVNIILNN